ncbi:MAG: MerC domain-containing protein [Legionellales bacterium]|nr:MerC domain-containing protein [Legionellales bacterium]
MILLNSKFKSHRHHGLLDLLAVSMSFICAIHCLLTPIAVALFPILSTTIWVKHDFHLWMILFVLPTTATAVFLGCRQHKDKVILILSIIGLGLLITVALYEAFSHYILLAHHDCANHGHGHGDEIFTNSVIVNIMGGILLSCAHIRNYWLCRKSRCSH